MNPEQKGGEVTFRLFDYRDLNAHLKFSAKKKNRAIQKDGSAKKGVNY